jgi:hypothetical protein
MIYLIGGYAVFVVLALGYAYSLVSRQNSLAAELDTVKAIKEND